MNISLDLLQQLDAIERLGSFAAAAQHLHRVPSAITHAIGKAEEQLGFALFERQGRRAVLTGAGRSLLEDGRQLLNAARHVEQRARQVASGWERSLTIAVNSLLPIDALFPLIATFHAEGHHTEIRVTHEVLAGCWDALLDGRADLVVGASGDMPAGGHLATALFGKIDMVFAMAPNHPLASLPEPLSADVLRQERAIAVADTTRTLAARTFGLLDGQQTLTVPDMESKAAAQAAGLGIGRLPRPLAEREVAAGRLVIRRLSEEKPPLQLHLAWHNQHRGKALQWFREQVLAEAEKILSTQG